MVADTPSRLTRWALPARLRLLPRAATDAGRTKRVRAGTSNTNKLRSGAQAPSGRRRELRNVCWTTSARPIEVIAASIGMRVDLFRRPVGMCRDGARVDIKASGIRCRGTCEVAGCTVLRKCSERSPREVVLTLSPQKCETSKLAAPPPPPPRSCPFPHWSQPKPP